TGKTLSAAGTIADGNGGNNYAVTFVIDTTGQITARSITVTASTDTKVYDGTTASAAIPSITGIVVPGDTAALSQSLDARAVWTGKTLSAAGTVADGNGGNNYAVTFVTDTTGQITARSITVTAATDTRTYDGTTASVAIPNISGGLGVG